MYTVTARIDGETQSQLEKLAVTTDRSRSWLVAEAIKQYVASQAWQVEAIEEGVRLADMGANAGAFASEEQVREAFGRWNVNV